MYKNTKPLTLEFNFSVILFVFMIPYFMDSWWKFLPSTVGILLITQFFIKKNTPFFLGLKISLRKAFLTIGLFAILFILFKVMILYQAKQYHLIYKAYEMRLEWSITILFQTLNEEIVLRAMLLNMLLRYFRINLLIMLLPAIFFTILHFLFYYLMEGTQLNTLSLITLLLFGIILNFLFMTFKHIWFGFAVHSAWNLTRFNYHFISNGLTLPEGLLFNYLEGTKTNVIFLLMTLLVIFICVKHKLVSRQ